MTLSDVRPPQPHAGEQEAGPEAGPAKTEGVQPMKKCHKEAQKIIQLIMRDFIYSWHTDITRDTEFPEDVQKILEHIALEINVRLQEVNLEEAVVELLELILPYLEVLNEAGIRSYNGIELFDVNTETCTKRFEANPKVAHYAVKSSAHEGRHYRQTLDALIQCAFPAEYAKCDVACTFVREILIANIVDPLFDLLCDPAFLYEAIPLILAKASPEKIYRQLDKIELENEELDRKLNRGCLIVNIKGSWGQTGRRFHTTSGRFGQGAYYGNIPSPFPSSSKKGLARPHSIATFPHMQKTSSGIYESSSWLTQSSQTLPRTVEEVSTEATYPPSTMSPQRLNSVVPRQTRNRDHFMYDNAIIETGELPEEDFADDAVHNVDGEFAVVELSPIYIERHVRVDTGNNSHIAYIFKVSGASCNCNISLLGGTTC